MSKDEKKTKVVEEPLDENTITEAIKAIILLSLV